MEDQEFQKAMQDIDEDLQARDVPIEKRELPAWLELGKQFGATGRQYLKKITEWYCKRYGNERMKLRLRIGEMPLIIKGEIYKASFPVVFGQINLDTLQYIEGLTPTMIQSLTKQELDAVKGKWVFGYEAFANIDHFFSSFWPKLSPEARDLFEVAVSDLEAAADLLSRTKNPDLDGSAFRSQQASEKFLKSFLCERGLTAKDLKQVGHKLTRCLAKCEQLDARFTHVSGDINKVDFSMDIRYQKGSVPKEEAAVAFEGALHIAKVTAIVLSPVGQSRAELLKENTC